MSKPESGAVAAEQTGSVEKATQVEGALISAVQGRTSANERAAEKSSETIASSEKSAIAEKAGVEVATAITAGSEKQGTEERTSAEELPLNKGMTERAVQPPFREEMTPALLPYKDNEQAAIDLARTLQQELQRVGCNTGAVDGNWDETSQRALLMFNRYGGATIDARLASPEALDAVKARTGRVCPLICQVGYSADHDRCVKLACKAGYQVGRRGNCEQIRAKRHAPRPDRGIQDRPHAAVELEAARPRVLATAPSNAGKSAPDQKASNRPAQR